MTPSPASTERIRTAFVRNARALARRPAIGRGTAVTTVRVRDGLCCEIQEGDWRLACDMTEKHGGTNTGPNPGTLGRGALGACLAMNYARWAAYYEIPLSSLTVAVEADYDAGGKYGTHDGRPGYEGVTTDRTTTALRYGSDEAAYARFDEATRAEAHADYLASIASYRAGDGYAIPGESVVVRGTRP